MGKDNGEREKSNETVQLEENAKAKRRNERGREESKKFRARLYRVAKLGSRSVQKERRIKFLNIATRFRNI